jgi:hypothetical protein
MKYLCIEFSGEKAPVFLSPPCHRKIILFLAATQLYEWGNNRLVKAGQRGEKNEEFSFHAKACGGNIGPAK